MVERVDQEKSLPPILERKPIQITPCNYKTRFLDPRVCTLEVNDLLWGELRYRDRYFQFNPMLYETYYGKAQHSMPYLLIRKGDQVFSTGDPDCVVLGIIRRTSKYDLPDSWHSVPDLLYGYFPQMEHNKERKAEFDKFLPPFNPATLPHVPKPDWFPQRNIEEMKREMEEAKFWNKVREKDRKAFYARMAEKPSAEGTERSKRKVGKTRKAA